MSCLVFKNRYRFMSQTAILALLVGAAGCSSDFNRFNQSFYRNAMPTKQEVASANPYPGDIDNTTTASIPGAPVPAVDVGVVPEMVYVRKSDQNTYASNQMYGNQIEASNGSYNGNKPRSLATYNSAQYQNQASQYVGSGQPETMQSYSSNVQSTYNNGYQNASGAYQQAGAKASGYYNNAKGSAANAYGTAQSRVKSQAGDYVNKGVDRINTGSIPKKYASNYSNPSVNQYMADDESEVLPMIDAVTDDNKVEQSMAASFNHGKERTVRQTPIRLAANGTPNLSGGWTPVGGTQIALREGETLYNLSKRFGVPVDALMEANNIDDPAAVKAGQKVLIPTYVFADSNPTSAPDANPATSASRASTGFMGEVSADKAAIPKQKPNDYVFDPARQSDNTHSADNSAKQAASQPAAQAIAKKTVAQASVDHSLVTGSIKKGEMRKYQVKTGDGLYGIAKRNGTTVEALRAANNITENNIRIGQWLKIPDGNSVSAPVQKTAKAVTKTTTKAETATKTAKAASSADSQENAANAAAKETKTTSRVAEIEHPKPYVKPSIGQIDTTKTASIDPAPQATGLGTMRWPVHGRLISKFGDRRGASRNDGIDISVPEGTAVKAAENGVVIYASNELKQFGNLILVRHEGGFVSAYANTKDFEVQKGDKVRRGQIIARSGRTGDVNQPQLHFELRKDSTPVDPTRYFSAS